MRDHYEQALAYVYYEEEPGRRSAAKLLSKDEARRIAANIAKLPDAAQPIMDGPQYNGLVLSPPLGEPAHECVFYRRTSHGRCNGAGPPRWNSAGSCALLTRDDARRIAANIAKLPDLPRGG